MPDGIDKLLERLGVDEESGPALANAIDKAPMHRPRRDEPDEEHGDFAHDPDGDVPVREWVPHPVSDSSDYLERPEPVYVEEEQDG